MAVITISRQSGSEGNIITQILCERLGYRYFDRKLMIQLGEKMGFKADQIVDASAEMHHVRGLMERMLGGSQPPFVDPMVKKYADLHDANEALSVQQVRLFITAAYQQGNLVIVGRGGQVTLADKPDVLHVRVIAPLETRIQRWQERENLSLKEAQDRVHERDNAHTDFIRRFFNAAVNEPGLYDLIINTQKITPQVAAGMIIKALEALPGFRAAK